jgi:tetratricopeptide (TPR) repeat protein
MNLFATRLAATGMWKRDGRTPMKPYAQALLATILLALSGAVAAAEPTHSPAQAMNLLTAGRYAELDRLMQGVQDQYRSGAISDEQLMAAFRVFYVNDPTQTSHFDKWIEQRPKSYVAQLARGIHLKYVGKKARGDEFISKTSDEQLEGMERAFRPAMESLRASMALDAKPLLSFHHLIDIGSYLGLREMNRDLMRAAENVDPKNFVVRRRFLLTLQTRWGGSVKEMQKFVDECRRVGLPADKLRVLERAVIVDQAWVYLYREEKYEAAARTYEVMIEEDPHDFDAMESLVWARIQLRQFDAAIAAATRRLAQDPKNVWTLTQRAWCYTRQKKGAEGIRDYLVAAELGHAPAQRELGRLYWHGTFGTANHQSALKWMRKAAEQGDEAAKKDLQWALKLSLPPNGADIEPIG